MSDYLERLRALEPEGVVQTEDAGQGYWDRTLVDPELWPLVVEALEAANAEREHSRAVDRASQVENRPSRLHEALDALEAAVRTSKP